MLLICFIKNANDPSFLTATGTFNKNAVFNFEQVEPTCQPLSFIEINERV